MCSYAATSMTFSTIHSQCYPTRFHSHSWHTPLLTNTFVWVCKGSRLSSLQGLGVSILVWNLIHLHNPFQIFLHRLCTICGLWWELWNKHRYCNFGRIRRTYLDSVQYGNGCLQCSQPIQSKQIQGMWPNNGQPYCGRSGRSQLDARYASIIQGLY